MYELKYQSDLSKLSADEVEAIKGFVLDDTTKEFISIQLEDQAIEDGDDYVTYLYGMYDMEYEELSNYNQNGGLWLYSHKDDIKELFI